MAKRFRQLWMFPRPHRRLTWAPQSLAAFIAVAGGRPWRSNRAAQVAFEDALDRAKLKTGGDYVDRHGGKGGSGGRTHASLLASLGLWLEIPALPGKPAAVHLTLAGKDLVEQKDALPIVTKQVLSHQYPSAYSDDIGLDPRFQLRPFVLLLRLLRHPELGGRLTDEEVAFCVMPYGERDTAQQADEIAARIGRFRQSGRASLEDGFVQRFLPERGKEARFWDATIDVANTCLQWLRYTGLVTTPSDTRAAVVVVEAQLGAIDDLIEHWGQKPLLPLIATAEGKAVFQRKYGLPPDAAKDTRRLTAESGLHDEERAHYLIAGVVLTMNGSEIVSEVDSALATSVVLRTGLARDVVERLLPDVVGTRTQSLGRFLDRYRQMAYGGRQEASDFEMATATAFREIIGLGATAVGHQGRVPDVLVQAQSWMGIVDTKAYRAYDLPSDHQLRMQVSYVPKYEDQNVAFFTYIAGGFAPNFSRALSRVIQASSTPGSGIGIAPWVTLLSHWTEADKTHEQLAELLQIGREVTMNDVKVFLDS